MNLEDKQLILSELSRQLKVEWNLIVKSAKEAKEYATSEESKAENKYDTRGLEASYLAQGQAQRALELKKVITYLEKLEIKSYKNQTIQAGALVLCCMNDSLNQWYFMLPQRGGSTIELKDYVVKSLSVQAPLGKKLVGKRVGDLIELQIHQKINEYEVLDLV